MARSSDCCQSTQSGSERGASLSGVWVTERAVVGETCVMEAARGSWSGWSGDLQPAEEATLAAGLAAMNGSVVAATLPAVAPRPAPAVAAAAGCSTLDFVAAAVVAAGVVVNLSGVDFAVVGPEVGCYLGPAAADSAAVVAAAECFP